MYNSMYLPLTFNKISQTLNDANMQFKGTICRKSDALKKAIAVLM